MDSTTTLFTTKTSPNITWADVTLLAIPSSLVNLLWFETIAACITYGVGFLGNILALIVFCSLEEFRKISTGVLFLLITVSNFFHLWTLATEFIAVYGFAVYSNAFLQCRLNFFIQNVSRAMSTYLSVGVAIDRLIRSEMPLRSRVLCTCRNVFKLTILCLIIFSGFWSFYLLSMSSLNSETSVCTYNQCAIYFVFLSNINVPIRAVVFGLIPLLVMAGSNIRMLSNIRQSHNRVSDAAQGTRSGAVGGSATGHSQASGRMSALDRMLFYMMLANVITFIISQVPFHAYTVLRIYITTLSPYIHVLIYAFLLIWSSLYFGIAFYLYCLASPLFRKKFIKLSKQLVHGHWLFCLPARI